MKVTQLPGSSAYQAYLHLALDEAVSAYEAAHKAVRRHPPLTEETATPELTLLHYSVEMREATALILAACCVEAVGNLYLGHKATHEQFDLLERTSFVDKWTVVPSLFVPSYSLPRNGQLYQDLKRLMVWRNALVHLKEEVTALGGSVLHQGSVPNRASDHHVFVCRCRSLPDRLLSHAASFDKTNAIAAVTMVLAVKPVMQEMRRLLDLPPHQLQQEMARKLRLDRAPAPQNESETAVHPSSRRGSSRPSARHPRRKRSS